MVSPARCAPSSAAPCSTHALRATFIISLLQGKSALRVVTICTRDKLERHHFILIHGSTGCLKHLRGCCHQPTNFFLFPRLTLWSNAHLFDIPFTIVVVARFDWSVFPFTVIHSCHYGPIPNQILVAYPSVLPWPLAAILNSPILLLHGLDGYYPCPESQLPSHGQGSHRLVFTKV